jgi:lysozyme
MAASRTPAALAKRAMVWLVLLAVAALIVWQFAIRWKPSEADFPMQGVDVSDKNGVIIWPSVAASGAKFAYIKASDGDEKRDAEFARNWAGAGAAGIKRGAYHFFNLCRDGKAQATNFIGTVPRDPVAMPPAIYFNLVGNCNTLPKRQVFLSELETFITMVEAHSGKPVILHVTREFEETYGVSEAVDRPLWLDSNFGLAPNYGTHPWIMWHASTNVRVKGIKGPVDWNVLRHDG